MYVCNEPIFHIQSSGVKLIYNILHNIEIRLRVRHFDMKSSINFSTTTGGFVTFQFAEDPILSLQNNVILSTSKSEFERAYSVVLLTVNTRGRGSANNYCLKHQMAPHTSIGLRLKQSCLPYLQDQL